MSDKVERKLRDVVLARYEYRHEAEFAAGFLEDAGIPFRLQVDDPALGMMVSTPATLWVRGMDVRDALDVLDLPERPEHEAAWVDAEAAFAASEELDELEGSAAETEGASAAALTTTQPDRAQGVHAGGPAGRRAGIGPVSGRLTPFERILGVGLFVATGSTLLVPAVGVVWAVTLTALGLPFGIAGVVGKAPGPVRDLLRAISGSAR